MLHIFIICGGGNTEDATTGDGYGLGMDQLVTTSIIQLGTKSSVWEYQAKYLWQLM